MTLDELLGDAVVRNVREALAEDVGTGDVTALLVDPETRGRATVITREDAVFCGRLWAIETCRQVDPRIAIEWNVDDGDRVTANQTLLTLEGPARGLLTAERTLLNFLQLLSATATLARSYADRVAG